MTEEIKSDALEEIEQAISIGVAWNWVEDPDRMKKGIIDSIFSPTTIWAIKQYLKEIEDKR